MTVRLLHRPLQLDLPAGHRLPCSQIHGVDANLVVPRLETAPPDDVDSDAQESLKILVQADVIKKGGAWLEIHDQVEIAVWISLSLAIEPNIATP